MNIHEHQAKKILKEFGAPVSNGVVILSVDEIKNEIKKLKSKEFVLKAQIHAGGRGKAGGVKLIKNIENIEIEARKMMGKTLITHQTGPDGKEVKRLYIEEASNILKEFYLSCLIDRESSKITYISSTEGGMDIEKVALETPNKIIKNKIDLKDDGPSKNEIENIISIFKFNEEQKKTAANIINSLYKIILEKDANLIEINP
jgi:succinyl-CoA synthetase beta subunit